MEPTSVQHIDREPLGSVAATPTGKIFIRSESGWVDVRTGRIFRRYVRGWKISPNRLHVSLT